MIEFARLGEEVEGAELEGLHGALHRAMAGEDHDLGEWPHRLDALEGCEAAHTGHLEIEDHYVERPLEEGPLHVLAARQRAHLAAGGAQFASQHLAEDIVVVDDEDRGKGRSHAPASAGGAASRGGRPGSWFHSPGCS